MCNWNLSHLPESKISFKLSDLVRTISFLFTGVDMWKNFPNDRKQVPIENCWSFGISFRFLIAAVENENQIALSAKG